MRQKNPKKLKNGLKVPQKVKKKVQKLLAAQNLQQTIFYCAGVPQFSAKEQKTSTLFYDL